MQESSLTISPAAKKIATGGAIGMCAGMLAAPEKYSLKRLLVQDKDSFKRIFTPQITKKMNAVEKNAITEIQNAAGQFLKSGSAEQKNVKPAAVAWAQEFKSIPIDETLAKNVENKKNYLKKVADNNNFVAIKLQLAKAKELLLEDLDNKFMREYYCRIKEQFNIAQKNLQKPIEEYRTVAREAYEERLKNLKKMPNRGIEIKQAFEKLKKAVAVKRTVTANKLYELTNNTSLKNNYKSISRFLPKARTRAAFQGALLLSTLTATGLIFFNPSPRKS